MVLLSNGLGMWTLLTLRLPGRGSFYLFAYEHFRNQCIHIVRDKQTVSWSVHLHGFSLCFFIVSPFCSCCFISLLSARVPFPQDLSALQMVFPQSCTYMLGLSPDFGVLLFIVLIVFLPHVVFLLFSSLSLLFPLSLCMCRRHSYCSYCFLLHSYCRVDYYKYSCML